MCASLLTCLFAASCGHALANPEDSLAKLPANLSVGRLAMNLRQSYDETRSTAYVDYALASQPVEILSDRHDIPKVVFNEGVLPIGAACMAHCAVEWLKENA